VCSSDLNSFVLSLSLSVARILGPVVNVLDRIPELYMEDDTGVDEKGGLIYVHNMKLQYYFAITISSFFFLSLGFLS
jgi:hypothetical protein